MGFALIGSALVVLYCREVIMRQVRSTGSLYLTERARAINILFTCCFRFEIMVSCPCCFTIGIKLHCEDVVDNSSQLVISAQDSLEANKARSINIKLIS